MILRDDHTEIELIMEKYIDCSLCDPSPPDEDFNDEDFKLSIGHAGPFFEPFPEIFQPLTYSSWPIGADTGTFHNDSYMLRQPHGYTTPLLPEPSSDQTIWTQQLASSSGCIPSPPVGLSSGLSDSSASNTSGSPPPTAVMTKKTQKRKSVTPEWKPRIGADTGTFNNDSYMLRQPHGYTTSLLPEPSSDQTIWTQQLASSSGCIPSPPVGLSSGLSDSSASNTSPPPTAAMTKKTRRRKSVTPELESRRAAEEFCTPIQTDKGLWFRCNLCFNDPNLKDRVMYRAGDITRHLRVMYHGPKSIFCPNRAGGCLSSFTRVDGLDRHLKNNSCKRWIPRSPRANSKKKILKET